MYRGKLGITCICEILFFTNIIEIYASQTQDFSQQLLTL